MSSTVRGSVLMTLVLWEIVCSIAGYLAGYSLSYFIPTIPFSGAEVLLQNILIILGFTGFVVSIGFFLDIVFAGIGTLAALLAVHFLFALGMHCFAAALELRKREKLAWTWAIQLAILGMIIGLIGLASPTWGVAAGFSLQGGILTGPWGIIGVFINVLILYYLTRSHVKSFFLD